ncbi:AMP-binding protein [uncultured Mycolicibacterium sp.]|uniref:AMP-binding protein n=1 Tax=uncultured Mycolicibacterium sp. TaxID=2320817 RepID=UPI002602EC7A|nr:AMP-binding protein [uncultured Mycolicibacterium sp.]
MSVITDLVDAAAARLPDRPAVIESGGATVSFAELRHRIEAVATWVAERSRPGAAVAVVADNSADYAVAYYAVPRAGRVLALINQRLGPAERAAQLRGLAPALVLGDPGYLAGVPDAVAFDSPAWAAALTGPPAPPPAPAPDDPAWLLFTSGSTGRPKPVRHTHRSILAAVRGAVAGRAVASDAVYLLPFPMCHIAGYNMLVHHAVAATVVLTAHFRPAEFVELVRRHGVTSCSLAPTMLQALLDHLDTTGTRLPTLRAIAYGSAAMPAGLIRRAIELLDVDFHQGYGMTETAGNVTFLGPDDHRSGDPRLLASAGYPHHDVRLRIVGADGAPLPPGGVGEIEVSGPQVCAPGWLRTGDVGRLDPDGRLYVLDRVKDVIITGGENVASREVEDVLSAHPAVAEVAVVGVPDPYWGEAVCAVVVPTPGVPRPEADELAGFVRARIAAFKRPRHVLFVDALPRTTNGKVAKDELRSRARAELGLDGIG